MYLGLILLGLLPSFAWLLFYLEEDLRPEPRRMIFFTFLAGAGVTVVVFFLQRWFNSEVLAWGGTQNNASSLIGLAAAEELFKFGAAYFVIAKSAAFDEPVDAMIYLIVAALGFAAVENIGALDTTVSAFAKHENGLALLGQAFQTTTLRFIGATLLHALTSAVVGYYWAKGIITRRVALFVASGLVLATGLHALFNYLILRFDEIIYATVFLVIVAFFVFSDFEKLKGAQS